MTKTRGASEGRRLLREQLVARLHYKGFSAEEIARQPTFNVGIRSIERDIQRIRANVRKNTEREEVRSWALADAEYGELWHELWIIFHRPPSEGKDDRAIKLAISAELRNVANDRNKLAFGTQTSSTAKPSSNSTSPVSEEAIAAAIDLLPTEMRTKALENLRKRIEFLEKSS